MLFLKPGENCFYFYSETFLGTGTNSTVLRCGPHALQILEVRDTTTMSEEHRKLLRRLWRPLVRGHIGQEILIGGRKGGLKNPARQ